MNICKKCDKNFTSQKRFKNHLEKEIPCDFVCICGKQLANYAGFRYHKKICPLSVKVSEIGPKATVFARQVDKKCKNIPQYTANIPQYTAIYRKMQYDAYTGDFIGEKCDKRCKFCAQEFSQSNAARRHEKYACDLNPRGKRTIFFCKSCDKNFSRKDALDRHEKECKKVVAQKIINNNVTNNNITNNNTIVNNNNNLTIQLNPFRHESLKHIKPKHYVMALRMGKVEAIIYLTLMIWNDINVKENNNIRITNTRSGECEIFSPQRTFEKGYKKGCVDFMMNFTIGKLLHFCHNYKKNKNLMKDAMAYPILLDFMENFLTNQEEK